MSDFLLELLSEEIPARMQLQARADLEKLFVAEIGKAGLKAERIETHATPRRLALIARGLPSQTAAVSEELKGPRAGAPPQALAGFLRKTGLTADQLVERDGVLFAVIDKPGRATAEVLAEAVPAVVRAFPWPKSMRWGEASLSTASLRWVRPLKGVVALLGDDVVPFEIDGLASGAETLGHRFHHPGAITIGNADDYVAKLRMCHVIVSHEERQQIIRDGAAKAAAAQGLAVVPDEGLVIENAGLTEWPVPILGSFDPAFLSVPREVIQLTMRTNQKYFAVVDGEGRLAPNFICTANIGATDGGAAIAAGNAKVLAARLSDAKFFWEQDLKVPLAEQAKKLDQIVFHEKLGTVAARVERIVALARSLAAIIPGADAEAAEAAARLAKADLVTGMVGEFPELQGVMGAYYARAEGQSDVVADAIRDHYKPVGQSDAVPTAPSTVVVSLAEKLDTLAAFWAIDEKPTGSKDPFALRRAVIAVSSIILLNNIRVCLVDILLHAVLQLKNVSGVAETMLAESSAAQILQPTDREGVAEIDWFARRTAESLFAFLIDRLKVQQREAGVRHDLIDAVFALGGEDDLVRLLARVKALQAFVATDDGANLLAGYKRAANILKKEGVSGVQDVALAHAPEDAEAALLAALEAAEPQARAAVAAEDFEGAMSALASLRAPIDAFFESVKVNDDVAEKRAFRLALLARVRAAVHSVADFSRIEG